MHSGDELEPFPESTYKDFIYALIKGGLSDLVPLVGGTFAELFGRLLKAPIERRLEEWLKKLAEKVMATEKKFDDFAFAKAFEDEAFLTTLLQAMRMAVATHQEEKWRALHNAVLNSASPNPPDKDLQLIYLNIIEPFTTWHLKLLTAFNDTVGWTVEDDGVTDPRTAYPLPPSHTLEHAFPELKGHHELYNFVLKELADKGLMEVKVRIDSHPAPPGQKGTRRFKYVTMLPTRLGLALRKFIASPVDD